MKYIEIGNKTSSASLGVFAAETETDALAQLAADVGYDSPDDLDVDDLAFDFHSVTKADESMVREWLNCQRAVWVGGAVWVADPMDGHWLSHDEIAEFIAFRESQ